MELIFKIKWVDFIRVYLQCNKAGAGGSPKTKLIWCCRIMLYPAFPFILNPISISVFAGDSEY
jgi:hypothetical protein